jgi:isocitrate dehydrogenase
MTKMITVAYGDGIGPEIMESAIEILSQSGAELEFNVIEVGKNIYEKGFSSGIMPSAWQDLNSSKILLKAPITTPQGGGYKSLNVTMRKKLGLFANVRPVKSLSPYITTKHPKMDVVIVRENEEDLYAGIEHRQTLQMHQSLKLITVEGCEKIIRYAFEYAVKNNRKKVSCFSKDNIMKITDGMFHKLFDSIKEEYPQIETDHYIIDIGTARLAAKPEIFDVIVTLNLYGDIISDVAAEISGSVGLAGSANIGQNFAMFEAIHGSAPDIAGKDIANPSGLINASIMMLCHIGQFDAANKIQDALHKTIEDGIHTGDIFNEKTSSKKVGTKEFTKAVIARLGQKPQKIAAANFKAVELSKTDYYKPNHAIFSKLGNELISQDKKMVGFDLFIDWKDEFDELLKILHNLEHDKLQVKMITARGLLMWPNIDNETLPPFAKGHTRLRFLAKGASGKASNDIIDASKVIDNQDMLKMMQILVDKNFEIIKLEGLFTFDGKAGYMAGQGE